MDELREFRCMKLLVGWVVQIDTPYAHDRKQAAFSDWDSMMKWLNEQAVAGDPAAAGEPS